VDMVNAHVKECISTSANSSALDVVSAYDFIEKELEGYKIKLNLAEEAIRRFREKHPGMVPQTEGSVIAKVEQIQSSKSDAEIRMQELQTKRDTLKKQLSGEKELTVALVEREGSPQSRLNYLNTQLMLLLTKYTDNYPEVIKIRSEIDELKKQINEATEQQKNEASGSRSETATMNPVYQQLREDLAKTDTEIESLRARMAELDRQGAERQTVLRTMPKEQEEWVRLERDRNVYQGLYDSLLGKLENARLSRDLELGERNATFRVDDPPVLPQFPIRPNPVNMILFGLFAGVASGIGVVVGLDYINPHFKSEKDLESALHLPLLASVPEIITEADRQASLVIDRKVYKATAIYLAIVGLLLIEEFIFRYVGISLKFW
jgi:protein tyrosine kinase modulator